MRKLVLSLSALALFIGLSQCTRPEVPEVGGGQTITQEITVTADFGDGSKVGFSDPATGELNLTWQSSDKIKVYNGVDFLTTLDYVSGSGASATFSGTISAPENSTLTFKVEKGTLNYVGQAGTFEWISGNYCLEGTQKYSPQGIYDVTMRLPYAILKLDLSALGTASPGTPVTISDGSVTVTLNGVTTTPHDYYIAMPVYDEGKTYTFSSSVGSVVNMWTLVANSFYTAANGTGGGTGSAINIEPLFSVSQTTKVRFSKSNLYYNGSTFLFEKYQYDYRTWQNCESCIDGTIEPNGTPTGNCGLFVWSKNESDAVSVDTWSNGVNDIFFTNDENNETSPNDDFIVNGEKGVWRTLTYEEWVYVLNINNSSDPLVGRQYANRFAMAKVNGVCGLLLFPDGYTGTVSGDGIGTINSTSEGFPSSNIQQVTWTSMVTAGVVFLPASNGRSGGAVGGGTFGNYWSSTPNTYNTAYYMYFDNGFSIKVGISSYQRVYGWAVRLVRNAN